MATLRTKSSADFSTSKLLLRKTWRIRGRQQRRGIIVVVAWIVAKAAMIAPCA